jgi:hypothetical protein
VAAVLSVVAGEPPARSGILRDPELPRDFIRPAVGGDGRTTDVMYTDARTVGAAHWDRFSWEKFKSGVEQEATRQEPVQCPE